MRRHNNGTWLSNQETRKQREFRNKLAMNFFGIVFVGSLVAVLYNLPPTVRFEVHNPVKAVAQAQERPWKEQVREILKEYKINPDEGEAIMFCESTLNPTAKNYNPPVHKDGKLIRAGSWDKGVWMINDVHKVPDEVRFDPVAATYAMIPIYKASGWNPWVVYKGKCYYRELAKLTK